MLFGSHFVNDQNDPLDLPQKDFESGLITNKFDWNMQNIYKTILVRRFLHLVDNYTKNALGPTKNVLDICIRYGLHQFVLMAIETIVQ